MPEKMSDIKAKTKRPRLSSEESYSSSSSSSFSSSSDDETDAKDLKPIKEYLSNRKELASQLFKSVKAEKIRMMLPQVLRKMDLNDLEELCSTELTGMSKKRITCIINDQEMLESSDTEEESDDSGPSLEIISDTEWISDDGAPSVKIEGAKSKNKKDSKKLNKKKPVGQKNQDSKDKSKLKTRGKEKAEAAGKSNVKVKTEKIKVEGKPKEKEKEKEKGKEGESLLDLLELEMRARAIRALIRKEEGTSGKKAAPKPNAETATSSDQSVKARQANLKEQLEKIDVLMKHGDDDDVYVVIQPAPTIELLSSDSENEDHSKRVNQKLASERKSEGENAPEKKQPDNTKTADTSKNKADADKEKDGCGVAGASRERDAKRTEIENENSNLPMSVTENNADEKQEQSKSNPPEDLEDGEIVDDGEGEEINKDNKEAKDPNDEADAASKKKKIKKIKKNPHIRSRRKSKDSDGDDSESGTATKKSAASDSKNDKGNAKKSEAKGESIEIEESPARQTEEVEKILGSSKENEKESVVKIALDDDKSLDIEEIVNLDDYPDDMDIIEKNETSDDKPESSTEVVAAAAAATETGQTKEADNVTSNRSETWASRYVKQDDVQNVIKESKIQSEIRKRLRERQRQSKMNGSPKSRDEEDSQPIPEVPAPKPTGSVREYLALKALSSGKSVSNSDDSSSPKSALPSEQPLANLQESQSASDSQPATASAVKESSGESGESLKIEDKQPDEGEKLDGEKVEATAAASTESSGIEVATSETKLDNSGQTDGNGQSKDDSLKSDSSDDNVIVRIDNTLVTSRTEQRDAEQPTDQ